MDCDRVSDRGHRWLRDRQARRRTGALQAARARVPRRHDRNDARGATLRCAPLTKRVLEHPGLTRTAAERNVLVVLTMHADDDGGSCYPAVSTLARYCDLDERSVRRILNRFRESGLLMIEERARQHRPTRYRLLIPASADMLPSLSNQSRVGAVPALARKVGDAERAPGVPARTLDPASPDPPVLRSDSDRHEIDKAPAAPIFLPDRRTPKPACVGLPKWSPADCSHEPRCPDQFVCRRLNLDAVRSKLWSGAASNGGRSHA